MTTFPQPDSFLSIVRALSVARHEGRSIEAILMSSSTWLSLHADVGKTPGEPESIFGVPIRIDEQIRRVRYVA